MVTVC